MKYDEVELEKINQDLSAAKQIIKPIVEFEVMSDEVVDDIDLNWLLIDQYNL